MEDLERRICELQAADPALLRRHAERIASLEQEVAKWQGWALTDPVTGALSERAHMADCESEGLGHGVLEVPDIHVVYDRCGTQSGRVFARDIADALAPVAAKRETRLYHLETPKFALIAPSVEVVKRTLGEIRLVLGELTKKVELRGGTAWTPGAGPPRTLAEFLDSAPNAFGAAVRAVSKRN